MTASLTLTGGVVEERPRGTLSSMVVCKHTHDVRVSAVAVKLTVQLDRVAHLLDAIVTFNKGGVVLCVRDGAPLHRTVPGHQFFDPDGLRGTRD